MPYIKDPRRPLFDDEINKLIEVLKNYNWTGGDVNYVISKIIWKLFDNDKNYQRASDLITALEGAKLEFYRRKVSIYEDQKIKENGDL
jgi:hypothetical protein